MTPDITKAYHGGNPESLDASRSLDPHKRLLMLQVESLLACAGPRGLTSDEVEQRLGMTHQTASARLTELKCRGLALPGERRMTRSGRWARALVYFEFWQDDV